MAESLPLEDLLDSWELSMQSRKRADRTILLYRDAAERLVVWLHGNGKSSRVADIDKATLEKYFLDFSHTTTKKGAPVKSSTVAMHYRSVRAIFGWIVKDGELDASPFSRMQEPSVDETPVPVFTTDEIAALLKSCKGKSFENRRDLAIISTFADTGIRLGEMSGLDVADLDLKGGTALVTGKGSRSRVVAMGAATAESIDRYLRARRGHKDAERKALWLGKRGRLTDSGITQILKRRAEEAGVEGMHPHRFRHTFAHQWMADGGNESDLQLVAGWKSDAMVRRYGASAATERAIQAGRQHSFVDRLNDK